MRLTLIYSQYSSFFYNMQINCCHPYRLTGLLTIVVTLPVMTG